MRENLPAKNSWCTTNNIKFDARKFCSKLSVHRFPAVPPNFIMICSDCSISGEVIIHKDAVIHPKVSLSATESGVTVGNRTMIEEYCIISGSSIEEDCLIEVGSHITMVKVAWTMSVAQYISHFSVLSLFSMIVVSGENNLCWPEMQDTELQNRKWLCCSACYYTGRSWDRWQHLCIYV